MYQYIAKRVLLVMPTLISAAALVFILDAPDPGDLFAVVRLGCGGRPSIRARSLLSTRNRPGPADLVQFLSSSGVLPVRFRHVDVVRQAGLTEIVARLPISLEIAISPR